MAGENAIKQGELAGIEFAIVGDRMISRHRLFVVHHRKIGADVGDVFALSITSVDGHKNDLASKDAERILDSFHLLIENSRKS